MLTVVAIFGVVAIYVGRILIVNERAYHTVENTSESQQNLRVFGELVEDDLRHAGMMVPRDAAVCGGDSTNAPDILYVSDAARDRPAGRLRSLRRPDRDRRHEPRPDRRGTVRGRSRSPRS